MCNKAHHCEDAEPTRARTHAKEDANGSSVGPLPPQTRLVTQHRRVLDFDSERMSVPTLEKFALFFRQHARLKAARTYDTHGKKQDDDLHA